MSKEQTGVDPVIAMDAQQLQKRAAATARTGDSVPIGSASQLFADDALIVETTSLHRRLNRPRKQGLLLKPAHPWEGVGLIYGSIVEEVDELRLYYKGISWGISDADYRAIHGYGKYPICLARSHDGGRTFSREAIQGAAIENTNMVLDDPIDDFTILKDHNAPDPAKRYKLLASKGNWWAGLSQATSPDGIHWSWGTEHAVPWFGDRCSYWYDPQRQKHIAWSRNYQILDGRHIFHKETDDFDNWQAYIAEHSHPKLVITPDRYDHQDTQFYGGYGFWYESMYFAYLEVYYIHQQRLDTQLCCSRDGLHWTRLCDREIFLPNGEHGEFDAYWAVPTFNPPVRRDGKLLIHYNGRPDPHAQPGFGHIPPGMSGAFGLSTLREDGFVSLDATGEEGRLNTVLLELPEQRDRIEVNACPFRSPSPQAPMELTLAVFNESGQVVAERAVPPTDDASVIWHAITFDQALPTKVSLRFSMKNARLYSFRVR